MLVLRSQGCKKFSSHGRADNWGSRFSKAKISAEAIETSLWSAAIASPDYTSTARLFPTDSRSRLGLKVYGELNTVWLLPMYHGGRRRAYNGCGPWTDEAIGPEPPPPKCPQLTWWMGRHVAYHHMLTATLKPPITGGYCRRITLLVSLLPYARFRSSSPVMDQRITTIRTTFAAYAAPVVYVLFLQCDNESRCLDDN
ncbi:hypothetical protein BDV93DRAFT_556979 [Ceratobasidium sp. AG-I]|nr:hypothetical protein BDV93DRAFT_556979 [Ceratobasidium sp. AG-I]